jgi:rod shape-determining protein MreC
MKRINLIAICIFIAAVIAVFTFDTETTRKIQSTVLSVFGFAHKAASAITYNEDLVDGVDISPEAFQKNYTHEQLAERYSGLVREVAELRIIKQRYDLVQHENAQLRASLDFKQGYSIPLKAARVIKRDASTWWSKMMIDKGDEDEIALGQPVVSQTGALLGKVIAVGSNTSMILLITDEQFQAAARIAGSNEQGIIMGTRSHLGISDGTPQIVLKYLSKDPDPGTRIIGEQVITVGNSNLDLQIFPSGVIVGKVKSFEKDLYGQAVIESEADVNTVTDVFVMMPKETKFVPRAAEEFSIEPESEIREAEPVPEPTEAAPPAAAVVPE